MLSSLKTFKRYCKAPSYVFLNKKFFDDGKKLLSISGFPKLFFKLLPLKNLKKILPLQQNYSKSYHLKHSDPFFLLFICNLRMSSVGFKIAPPPYQLLTSPTSENPDLYGRFLCQIKIVLLNM